MRKRWIVLGCFLLAACGPRDTRPDPEKLADFRHQVAAIDQRVTAASSAYTTASTAALDRGDRAGFDRAAQALRASLDAIRPDAAGLKAPEFANRGAQGDAAQLLAALVAGIDANQDAATAIQRMRDPRHPTPDEVADIQNARDKVSTASVAESDALFSLIGDLGTNK